METLWRSPAKDSDQRNRDVRDEDYKATAFTALVSVEQAERKIWHALVS